MKRTFLFITLITLTLMSYGQKKPLDHDAYDGWKHVESTQISDQGNYVALQVNPQEGDGYLTLQRVKDNHQLYIDRGYNVTMLPNEQYAVVLIKPFFTDTRQARIKKKKADEMPKDTLAIIRLSDLSVTKIAHVNGYKIATEGNEAVAFLSADTTGLGKKAPKEGKPLVVYHFADGKTDTIKQVDKYNFSTNGHSIVYTTDDGKHHPTVGIYSIATRNAQELAQGDKFYSLPTFDVQGNQILYLASTDSIDTGTKHCDLYYFKKGETSVRKLVSHDYTQGLPEGWGINQYSSPFFSENGNRIFVGIAQHIAPKDTSRVSFETAGLDLWSYNAAELPPSELKNMNRIKERTCLAVVNNSGTLTPLTTSVYDRIILPDQGNAKYAISIDRTSHMVESQWTYQLPNVVSIVNLQNGQRTQILNGVYASVQPSPTGKYILYYDYGQKGWFTYEVDSRTIRNLTAQTGTNFWNELSDTPSEPSPYGMAAWVENDAQVLLYDRFDIWSFAPDGSSTQCLTAGHGRATGITYRYLHTKYRSSVPGNFGTLARTDAITAKEQLLLSVFDNSTKQGGYAILRGLKPAEPTLAVKDNHVFTGLKKARNANSFLFQKQDFQHCADAYLTTNLWKTDRKLTDANPQQAEYSWGTAELFHWNAYDGTPLDGLLYKPEGFDENKKYPVMIYFYERRSENLYAYYEPAPSRSTVNISFYTSRGYICFVPDIVYTAGLPGESAYNCICAGAEALAKNKWVDKNNMAIQGQSWGGYQTAYLITRTNMFKAAGSGAPVSNMTSAYGGIRWESGNSRQGQYEHGQSRIGRNLWEAPELYIANSPLFKADRIQTPVLIMHNDADGAVPWYQGIEFFMALRRLGKPAWLLQYNDEAHNLAQRRNQKDLSVRLQQFFDHYLKGAPAPAWLTSGVPSIKKGEYFGFETE